MLNRYKTTSGAVIVGKTVRHYTGTVGIYGCAEHWYLQDGFSCGARYYFDADFAELTLVGPFKGE